MSTLSGLMSAFYTPPKAPSYSTSAYIAPSDTGYHSTIGDGYHVSSGGISEGYHSHSDPATLSFSYPISPDLDTPEHGHDDTPVYLPELDTISYGDKLYGSEYRVGLSLSFFTQHYTAARAHSQQYNPDCRS